MYAGDDVVPIEGVVPKECHRRKGPDRTHPVRVVCADRVAGGTAAPGDLGGGRRGYGGTPRRICPRTSRTTGTKWAKKLTEDDRRGLNALFWSKVNPYGTFRLDLDSRLDLDLAA